MTARETILYDGTWDGLLTALFDAYKLTDASVVSARAAQPSLFGARFAETDGEKARRLSKGMARLGADVPVIAYRGFLAELEGYEDALLESLKLGFELNADPFTQRQQPFVHKVCTAERRAGAEAHLFKGITRFTETESEDGPVYAGDISPDCNILPLLGEHFHRRFTGQRLILRDARRMTALVSGAEAWWITELDELVPIADATGYESMWRAYFKSMAQRERVNRNLQRQFVPLKYRQHMPEFGGEAPQ